MDQRRNLAERVPPLTANLGVACYNCFKGKNEVALRRCTSCFRVSYCGSECQKSNWRKHKTICKAFNTLESKQEVMLPYIPKDGNPDYVDVKMKMVAQFEMNILMGELGRNLTVIERNMIGWQPRCLACGRSDYVARMESTGNGQPPLLPSAHPCPKCSISFCCSESHWSEVRSAHEEDPCEDGWNGLTQCEMNQIFLADVKIAQDMPDEGGPFKWAPERTVPAWATLRNTGWKDSYMDELKKVVDGQSIPDHVFEPMLRGATEALSMPMTILWALELLNADTDWTRKETLNIHILGAANIEIFNSPMFEEILHRLPEVKNLRLVMCGPELLTISGRDSASHTMDICPECVKRGRSRVHDIEPQKYHEYIMNKGDQFQKPDLAVAFNSGCSQEDEQSWENTIVTLVVRHIPSVFTAYNREEAIAEAQLLEEGGAVLHPELGPCKNPWGSQMPKMEPNRVTGFYTVNGWLAGGFR